MFLKCFWLLRKPSDQKIFLLMNGSITFEFYEFEDFHAFFLAKISLWSVWRDLREAKCVNSGELYENLQIFVDLHSVSKVLRRYGAFD